MATCRKDSPPTVKQALKPTAASRHAVPPTYTQEMMGEASRLHDESYPEVARASSSPSFHSDSSNSCGEPVVVVKQEIIEDDHIQDSIINSTGRRKMAARPVKDKVCLVCGDKALGYNFNAISCESCKAFFRRNAAKTIRGRCEGKCEVTVESRSYCKRCRLQKCFSVGMKRDLILSDSQKQIRRSKIQNNRLRRLGLPLPEGADDSLSLDDIKAEDLEDDEEEEAAGAGALREPPPTNTHVIASEISEDALRKLPQPLREKMEEIIQAFRVSFDVPIHREVISNPNNAEFLNMADASVRRLVKMGKNLSTFRSISQEDQVALLKGSVLEVLILRSIKMFDRRTMNWHVKRSGTEHTVSATGLQANKDSMAFLEQYQKFATGVMMSIQGDMALLMLLMVLSVFSPDRPNVKNKAVVSEAQEGYARLLQEYVNVRFPTADSSLFGKILQKLADIRDLDETHAKMLLHMNVDQLEPLIVEIFDLSS